MKKNGIAVAGNMIVDVLYPIIGHPKPGELTTITEGISRSSGGALCNVIVDLAKLDPALPLTALGLALAWVFTATGSLWGAVALHSAFNAVAVLAWALDWVR